MQQVSDYELELLKVIWNCGGTVLYAEIVEALSAKEKNWTKNTIITLLSRLADKGYLRTSKIGRRNQYTALVSESDYQFTQTEHFIDKIYEGNVKGLVAALSQTDLLSEDDYEEVKAYWKKAGEQHE